MNEPRGHLLESEPFDLSATLRSSLVPVEDVSAMPEVRQQRYGVVAVDERRTAFIQLLLPTTQVVAASCR